MPVEDSRQGVAPNVADTLLFALTSTLHVLPAMASQPVQLVTWSTTLVPAALSVT